MLHFILLFYIFSLILSCLCMQRIAIDDITGPYCLLGSTCDCEPLQGNWPHSCTDLLHLCDGFHLLIRGWLWPDPQHPLLRDFPHSGPWHLHRNLRWRHVVKQRVHHVRVSDPKPALRTTRSVRLLRHSHFHSLDFCVPIRPGDERPAPGDHLRDLCPGCKECWEKGSIR